MHVNEAIRQHSCKCCFRLGLHLALVSIVLIAGSSVAMAQQPEDARQSYSDSIAIRVRRIEPTDPNAVLRNAKLIYVRSVSLLVATEDIENKLRKHPDFQRLGMFVTKEAGDADLILEVRRGVLTKFVFTAIDPKSSIVVASGKLSSLGGTVDGKVAKLFMKQVMAARQ